MNVCGTGTLLIGKSGIGKSDIALSLLDRGHQLIADDIIEFSCLENNILLGKPPTLLARFLEVRGFGVLDIVALFGEKAVASEYVLSLVIGLDKPLVLERHINVQFYTWQLLGVTVPHYYLPLSNCRPDALLVEVCVRNYQLDPSKERKPYAYKIE